MCIVFFFLFVAIQLVTGETVSLYVSERIDDVVDAYEHALLAKYPRARYVIGNDAKYILLPIQRLPEFLSDWLMRILSKDHPKPAGRVRD
jgi:nucleoside-diphosphate-sugar epimerase